MSNGSIAIDSYAVGEWVDVVIPKAKLNTAYTKNNKGNWTYSTQYVGNKENLDKDNPAKTDSDFDKVFNGLHGTGSENSNDYIADNFLTTFTYMSKAYYYKTGDYSLENGVTLRPHDVTLSCYIDTITWGVDYTAPTIENVKVDTYFESVEAETVAYTPTYEVKEDILPQDLSTAHGCLIESEAKVFEKGSTNEAEKDTNGAYVLNRGTEYTLQISAWDWSVSDIDGNKRTEEYDIILEEMNLIDFSNEKNMSNVSTALNGDRHEVEWIESLEDRNKTLQNGVMKLGTNMPSGSNNGAALVLNFAPGRVERILTEYYAALADDAVNFELKITMMIEVGEIGNYTDGLQSYGKPTWDEDAKAYTSAGWGINFYGGRTGYKHPYTAEDGTKKNASVNYLGGTDENGHLIPIGHNENLLIDATEASTALYNNWANVKKMGDAVWYDVVFTEELLRDYCGWLDTEAGREQARQELSGETWFIRFGNGYYVLASQDVTYFIDEISYGTTTT